MLVLFRWLFTDGVVAGLFSRTGSATFATRVVADLDPAFIRATDLSEPSIRVRDARVGLTL